MTALQGIRVRAVSALLVTMLSLLPDEEQVKLINWAARQVKDIT